MTSYVKNTQASLPPKNSSPKQNLVHIISKPNVQEFINGIVSNYICSLSDMTYLDVKTLN